MDFEDMMGELMGDDDLEKELRENIPPVVSILGIVYDEMIMGGFSEEQSFQFAKDFIFLFFNSIILDKL